MKFMVIVKGDEKTEAGVMPTEGELAEMGNFNEELVKAGAMLAGEGLQPTSKGVKIRYSGDERRVIDGPFTESKEIIAGFWIIDVASRDEAVEWMKRAPFREGEVEIRPVFESDDFGDAFTPELRAQEETQRARIAEQQQRG